MAIIGHFNDLDEAQKLVQDKLVAGVIQQIYEEGQLLKRLPVTQIDSRSLIYRRESTLPAAAFYGIGDEIPWTGSVTFTSAQCWLKRMALSEPLDNFMAKNYKNPNEYRTVVLSQMVKGSLSTLETKLIYGNGATEAAYEFDGIDKLCPATGDHTFAAGYQDYDAGGSTNGLTIALMRQLIDAVKPKPHVLLMTRTTANALSAAAFEKGINTNVPGGLIGLTKADFGARVEAFDNIPIIRSDYLGYENDNTGGYLGSGGLVSVYAIRFGQIEDGGLCLCVGADTGGADFFKVVELPDLESYDATGIRLVAYVCLALGSTKAIARVHSICEATAVA